MLNCENLSYNLVILIIECQYAKAGLPFKKKLINHFLQFTILGIPTLTGV